MTEHDLANRLAQASQQVVVGGCYMHYKQKYYKVLYVGLLEETGEPCVVYQAQYPPMITFIRPLTSWSATIEQQGKKIKRFILIDK